MFAINHAATALVIKKKYPGASLIWLLVSVQFVELLWVGLNFLGIEMTTTESVVRSVADIHLSYMPFSHSIFMTLLFATVAWVVLSKILRKPVLAAAVALGITSHIVLDLLTHSADIAVFPFGGSPEWGLGLYSIPMMGLIAETAYGIWCWWVYKGSRALLATIVLFNLANLSFFSTTLIGPEALLAHHPMVITGLIFVQIVTTLVIVGLLASRQEATMWQKDHATT